MQPIISILRAWFRSEQPPERGLVRFRAAVLHGNGAREITVDVPRELAHKFTLHPLKP